ncbi:MAG: hypothetical protein ACO1O6_13680 [Bacteroidota bacterium]
MKLEFVNKNHIEQAASLIDEQGIPKDEVWSQYYMLVNGKEYQANHLARIAYHLATQENRKIELSEADRIYFESLGHEFRFFEDGYNFFTKEELKFYNSIANTEYRKANPDHQFYKQKLNPIISKLNYWAEQILVENFVSKEDNNWLTNYTSRIKPYLWPKIYSGTNNDIYFNVEVNGEDEFIGYKLDGYFSTSKKLPDNKLKLLQEYKGLSDIKWPQIPFHEIEKYGWERLIKETRAYIQKYLPHHNYLKQILSKETKLCRVAWNSNGWVKPSGRNGKSTNPSFEKENGFGHEEWLFDGDKLIGEYKYGFLEPIHKHFSTYAGKTFDLVLYTRNADTNQSFWVTTLKDVEVIQVEDAKQVLVHYKREGWYNFMKADLQNLSLNPDQLDEWVQEGAQQLFNVRFKASQINEIPKELIPVLDEREIPSNRYKLMNISDSIQLNIDYRRKKGFSFEDSGSEEADLKTKSRQNIQKKEVELDLKHNNLQIKFLKYLQNKYGKSAVKRECMAYGASRIDITRKTSTGYVFYEIKTYNSLLTSIREGLGQLLEYCLYPNVNEAESIVLVSHVTPTDEVKDYLMHIKKFIGIPFSYIHFDIEKEEVISVT